MGIKFYCPNGHKVNVKSFLAGKKGLCPKCGVRVDIPLHSVSTGQSTATLTNGTTSLIDPDELVDQISSVAPTAEASNGMTLVQEMSRFDATQQPADSESEVSPYNLSEHFTAGSAAKTHDEALHADDLRLPPGFAQAHLARRQILSGTSNLPTASNLVHWTTPCYRVGLPRAELVRTISFGVKVGRNGNRQ